ncbi:LppP/LprE family lipoprotein [Corynebacterium lowii]|uniref:LppP/LprE lipoprotein n=1 Tax=Corynebacterium lowii TaxID=1544413 RepID=A0A0Q0TZS6_9CORY|nr:LppP/LprE family lipoprotein [Corynebacterium lowii]KQB84803.1 hypothetical protein Clow_02063 [Corynebacterium lowii]MDP9851707.1 hypothetical protein [Corynebacterium lowii]
MKLRPLRFSALVCTTALVLSACGNSEETIDATPAPSSPSAASATSATKAASTTTAAPTTTEKPTKEASKPKNCRSIMLSDTNLLPVLASRTVPLVAGGGQTGASAHLGEVANNQFDPCKNLSWVAFAGSFEGAETPQVFNTLVFFHKDELITTPLPAEVRSIIDVTRRSDSELEITSGRPDPDAPEGEERLIESVSTVLYKDGGLTITSADPEDPLAHPTAQLDLTSPAPDTQGRLYLQGNVYKDAYDQEITSAEGSSQDAVLIDVDRSLSVYCVVQGQPLCQAADINKADWIPGSTNDAGTAVFQQDAEYHANQIRMASADPLRIEAVEEQLEGYTTVADVNRGKKVLFDGYIFDTTHDGEVRIYDSEDADSAIWFNTKEYGVRKRG